MENVKEEYLVTLVMKNVALPLGYYSKEVAETMKKEIEFQAKSCLSNYVETVIIT